MLTGADGAPTRPGLAETPLGNLWGVAAAMGAWFVPIGAHAARGSGVVGASAPTLPPGAHDVREHTVLWAPDSYRQAVCGVKSGTPGRYSRAAGT